MSMAPGNMFTYLSAYCERAGAAGLWAEPLNALTNIAFVVAAYYSYRLWRGWEGFRLRTHGDIAALTAILAVIGIGSGLWHTHVAPWSLLADVIPIVIFIHLYLLAALKRLLGLRWLGVLACWVAFVLLQQAADAWLPADFLNGSIMYLPTYFTLLILTAVLFRQNPAYGKQFAIVVGIFTLSLCFRTIDLELCDIFPYGTHFLWHIFNSILLYRLLALLVQHVRVARSE
jgi:hypothetical protein